LTQKYELIALKQSSTDVQENHIRDVVDQTDDAFGESIRRFCEFKGIQKDRVERFERKLVQHVDPVEIINDKVEKAASRCH